ncbi:MAG: 23S rRNA (adenine(2503)-C(2))-methyltransferase RlmN [Saprospiraceae bacterium]
MTTAVVKIDIRQLEYSDLEEWFLANEEKRFRAKQVYEWLWKKGAHDFEEMTNLSKSLRQKLSAHFVINAIVEDKVQYSNDGTIKFRFKLHDGHLIEAVLIPVVKDNRFTVCVSSQVGCSLTCTFCATGKMKRIRNIDAAEIYDQVLLVNRVAEQHFDHPLTNIVYMGMGEPLLAYKNVLKSVELISSPEGLHMSPRRITVSTAGIAKMIRKLADDEVRFNLALSLHAADDEKRNKIMPINDTNNLATLMDALEYFYKKTRNRISYEYIALQGVNDSIEDARNLVKLCKRFPVRLNIIEYNPIGDGLFEKSEVDTIDRFAHYLTDHDVTVTVRRSRGKDIDAACGQLANKG